MSALQDYGVVLGIVAVLSLLLLLISLVRKRKSADLGSRLRPA